MPVREAALRPLYKKIDALITDKVKDFFEMADGYSDVVVKNGTPLLPPQWVDLVSALALALALALTLALPPGRSRSRSPSPSPSPGPDPDPDPNQVCHLR